MDIKIIDCLVTNENLLNDIYNIYCELFDKINQNDLIIKELKGNFFFKNSNIILFEFIDHLFVSIKVV